MVFKRPPNAAPKQRKGINKLILGFASVAAAAVIGTTAFAAAATGDKPTKDQCSKAGYKNYGQCVKDWAKNKHTGGGYGNTVNVGVNVELNNSNNNVIEIIVNIFQ
jgi:opacity protein-like surface antigen